MKRTISRWAALTVSAVAVLVLCLWAQAEYDWLGSSEHYRMGWAIDWTFVLLWPAIALARWDLSHPWIVIPVGALLVTFLLAWRITSKPWVTLPAVAALLAIGYCFAGRLVFGELDVPMPSVTPYDSVAADRQEYLDAYWEGYHFGASGCITTYCFRPQHTTRGFYAGLAKGIGDYNRMIGRMKVPTRDANLIRRWAATDGVRETPAAPRVEPAGADQPATRSRV